MTELDTAGASYYCRTLNLTAEARMFHTWIEFGGALGCTARSPPKGGDRCQPTIAIGVCGAFRAEEREFILEASAAQIERKDDGHALPIARGVTMSPIVAGFDAMWVDLRRWMAAAAISLHSHRHRRARLPGDRQHHRH